MLALIGGFLMSMNQGGADATSPEIPSFAVVVGSMCPKARDVTLDGRPMGLSVGQVLSQQTVRLLKMRGGRAVRILEGMGIGTMNFVPGRLSILIDSERRIRSLNCG